MKDKNNDARQRILYAKGFWLVLVGRQLENRLAVYIWSLQPQSPKQLVGHLKTIGIPRMQFALDPLHSVGNLAGGSSAAASPSTRAT